MTRVVFEAEISIENGNWGDVSSLIEKCFEAVTSIKEINPKGGIISFLFCDDEAIQALNKEYRGKEKATNVLSFPSELDYPEDIPDLTPLIGDIAIAYETCVKEASDLQIDFESHLTHLIIHGILHLLGYDHIEDAEAEQMEQLERDLLAKMGLDDPYSRMEKLNG